MIVKHQCHIVTGSPDPTWLTTREAAKYLGMTYEQLAYKIHFGAISYYARVHTRPTKRWISCQQLREYAKDNGIVLEQGEKE